jgi:hypothetical protein
MVFIHLARKPKLQARDRRRPQTRILVKGPKNLVKFEIQGAGGKDSFALKEYYKLRKFIILQKTRGDSTPIELFVRDVGLLPKIGAI